MNTIVVKEATGSLEKVHLVSHQVTGLCIGNYGFSSSLVSFSRYPSPRTTCRVSAHMFKNLRA